MNVSVFCLKLISREHIGIKEFKKVNSLPTKQRVQQRIATKGFNYWKSTFRLYLNEIYITVALICVTLGHIWFWRYLWKKISEVKRAFHLLDHLFGTN